MPPEISKEIKARIKELLLEGLNGVEVERELLTRFGMRASQTTIGKEAYRLDIRLPSGPKPGTKRPGVGGRPKGPGKKFSPNRQRCLEMHEAGSSDAEIALALGITKQAVSRILVGNRKKPPSGQ